MNHFIRLFLILFLFISTASNYAQESADITIPELRQHISFLASDSLKGRKPGTNEDKIAANYIREQLIQNKLSLLGDDGFQKFSVLSSIEAGENNTLQSGNFQAELGKDFTPLSFSENGKLSATLAFVGYGFDFEKDSLAWNDYDGVDVQNKWCLMLRGDPEIDNPNSPYSPYSSLRKKVLVAKDHGATGVIFVSGEKFDKEDQLIELIYDKSMSNAGIPVIHIKRALADLILKDQNKTIANLEKVLNETKKPHSFETGQTVAAEVEIIKNEDLTQNIVALLPGSDDVLKNEYIVIGAHYDHLGMGGPGSGSRRPDTLAIHNGADDNASGVAAILEIVEKLAAQKNDLKRSVIFVAFGAEEMGTLGSSFFVNNPLVDLKRIKFMFNLDMIGRLDTLNSNLSIGGVGTARELEDLVKNIADQHKLKISVSKEGYGPSDHANFYANDIPVLAFFTGAHEDYHTPADDVEFINFDGEKMISDIVFDLAKRVANQPKAFVYQQAGPKERPGGRRRFKVTLGIMPDHVATDIKGMKVQLVIKDRPAYLGGMQKGDIIVAMEGKPVNDIYDYMNRLNEFKPGQRISIEVMRNGKKEILIVEL